MQVLYRLAQNSVNRAAFYLAQVKTGTSA